MKNVNKENVRKAINDNLERLNLLLRAKKHSSTRTIDTIHVLLIQIGTWIEEHECRHVKED